MTETCVTIWKQRCPPARIGPSDEAMEPDVNEYTMALVALVKAGCDPGTHSVRATYDIHTDSVVYAMTARTPEDLPPMKTAHDTWREAHQKRIEVEDTICRERDARRNRERELELARTVAQSAEAIAYEEMFVEARNP